MPHCTTQDAFSVVKDLTRNLSLLSVLNSDEQCQDKGCFNYWIVINKRYFLEKFKNECLRRLETLDIALQTLCAVCDAHPVDCTTFVFKWALDEFLKLVEYVTEGWLFYLINFIWFLSFLDLENSNSIIHFTISQIPFSLYNLILSPLQLPIKSDLNDIDVDSLEEVIKDESNIKSTNNFLLFLDGIKRIKNLSSINFEKSTNLISLSENNAGWTCYKIARCALRCGHWRNIALPLLEEIFKTVNFKFVKF